MQVNASIIMTRRDMPPGPMGKIVMLGTNEFLPPSLALGPAKTTSTTVSLSAAAVEITALLQHGHDSGASSAVGFDDFINGLHQQLLEHGKDAETLKTLPDSFNPARVALAKQAANYLLTDLYDGEPLYERISSENPFAGVDRQSLSAIAFNDSGAFSPAERHVAFLELTTRDVEHGNKIHDFQQTLNRSHGEAHWSEITGFLRSAQIAATMSEGEKAWRGWPSVEELKVRAQWFMDQAGVEEPELPVYEHLVAPADTLLAAVAVRDGSVSWEYIPLDQYDADGRRISLLDVLKNSAVAQPQAGGANTNPWISLYLSIHDYV